MKNNIENWYTYNLNRGRVCGAFNIYQAVNGKIYIVMGNNHTALTEKQILDLSIDIYSLDCFDYDLYKKGYNK